MDPFAHKRCATYGNMIIITKMLRRGGCMVRIRYKGQWLGKTCDCIV